MRYIQVTALAAAFVLCAAAPAATALGNGRIAYSTATGIYTVNPDGSGTAFLHDGSLPVFSPDGMRILYVSDGVNVANADGSKPVKIRDEALPNQFAWSPDSQRIALFAGGDSNVGFSLVVVRADGTGSTTVATGASPVAPSWSPDGARLAFTTAQNRDLAIANADGSGATKLIDDEAVDVAPSWSPDGSKIVFFRRGAYSLLLYEIRPDGRGLRQLGSTAAQAPEPYSQGFQSPAWAPDGSQIVFTRSIPYSYSRGGIEYRTDVYSIDADGSNERRLTDSSSLGAGPSPVWSPDGTRIAFLSIRGGYSPNLFEMNADGSCETRITSGSAPVSAPTWQAISAPAASPLSCAALSVNGVVSSPRDHPYTDDTRTYVYSGVIRNVGNLSSDPIHLHATSDGAITFVSTFVSGNANCKLSADADCTLPSLRPGESIEFELRYRVLVRGTYTLAVSVAGLGATPDGDDSDNIDAQRRAYPFCEVSAQNGATLRGSSDDDLLCGTVGRDRIFSAGGNDTVLAGNGHDVVYLGPGRDDVFGGSNSDYLYGQAGRDRLRGEDGADVLYGGDGFDRLIGGGGGDFLNGGAGPDVLDASWGDDRIDARDGVRDQVQCGEGHDVVRADLRDVLHYCERVERKPAQTFAPR